MAAKWHQSGGSCQLGQNNESGNEISKQASAKWRRHQRGEIAASLYRNGNGETMKMASAAKYRWRGEKHENRRQWQRMAAKHRRNNQIWRKKYQSARKIISHQHGVAA
jgi:hypothetical protein